MAKTSKLKKKSKKALDVEVRQLIDLRSSTVPCRRCDRFEISDPAMNGATGKLANSKGQAKFYFLDQVPNREAARRGDIHTGITEFEFYEVIQDAGIRDRDVYHDVLIRCGLEQEANQYTSALLLGMAKNCLPYTLTEIERLAPRVIFTIGDRPLYMLTGLQGANLYEGRHIAHRGYNAWVVPLRSYAEILGSRRHRDRTVEILRGAATLEAPQFSTIEKVPVLNDELFDQVMGLMESADRFVVDFETHRLDPFDPESWIIGVALACGPDTGYFIPFREPHDSPFNNHHHWEDKERLTAAQKKRLRRLLADPKKIKIGHNMAFDRKFGALHGFPIAWPFRDTMLVNTVVDNTENGLKELTYIHTDHGGYEAPLEEAIVEIKREMRKVGRKVGEFSYAMIPPETLMPYACLDGALTYRLDTVQQAMALNPLQAQLVDNVCRMRRELTDMELRGARVDLKKTKALIPKYRDEIKEIQGQIDKALGRGEENSLNVNSTAQLQTVMYGPTGFFPGREGSTDQDAIDTILYGIEQSKRVTRRQIAIRDTLTLIQNYRKRDKLLSTYLESFVTRSRDGRVHTSYTQHIARTARLTSLDPNLQNIPRKGDIKDLFIADPGMALAELDASQLELRIAANESRDPIMLELLNSGQDIHSETGVGAIMRPDGTPYPREVFMSSGPLADEELRAAAKIVGFSTIYGKMAKTLAKDLKISTVRAQDILDRLFIKYEGLAQYVERQNRLVEQQDYIVTAFGRKLMIYGGDSPDKWRRAEAHRKSVNYPIQSAAADCVMIAITRLGDWLRYHRIPIIPILTVHDSILLMGALDVLKTYLRPIRDVLEQPIEQIKYAKLFFDCKVGARWGSLKKVNLNEYPEIAA